MTCRLKSRTILAPRCVRASRLLPCCANGRLRNQSLEGYVQFAVERSDHCQRELAPSVQDLRHSRSRPEDRLEHLACLPLLLEAELDCLDGVGRQDGVVDRKSTRLNSS